MAIDMSLKVLPFSEMSIEQAIEDAVQTRVDMGKQKAEDVDTLREVIIKVDSDDEGIRRPTHCKHHEDSEQGT